MIFAVALDSLDSTYQMEHVNMVRNYAGQIKSRVFEVLLTNISDTYANVWLLTPKDEKWLLLRDFVESIIDLEKSRWSSLAEARDTLRTELHSTFKVVPFTYVSPERYPLSNFTLFEFEERHILQIPEAILVARLQV